MSDLLYVYSKFPSNLGLLQFLISVVEEGAVLWVSTFASQEFKPLKPWGEYNTAGPSLTGRHRGPPGCAGSSREWFPSPLPMEFWWCNLWISLKHCSALRLTSPHLGKKEKTVYMSQWIAQLSDGHMTFVHRCWKSSVSLRQRSASKG